MKRAITTLVTGTIACVIVLLLLVRFSGMPNEQKNGFTRRWLSAAIYPLHQADIHAPYQYIAGATRSHFFLAVPNPKWLVMTDYSLQRQDTFSFPVPLSDKLTSLHTCTVDSPWIYLHANNIPALFYAHVDSGRMRAVRLSTGLFTKSVQVSVSCLVVRAFDSVLKRQVFEKVDTRTGKVTGQAAIISQEKEDAGLSTDGLLRYDSLTRRLLFIQFYQNRFFCLDTNLTLQYTGHTIDTIRTNSVDVQQVHIEGEDRYMPAAPRVTVNQQSCVSNGYLFIVSGLIADNEDKGTFRGNGVIDCYRIGDGSYAGSFHLPYPAGEKISSIYVAGGFLSVLYRSKMAVFKLEI